jgi:hypothetical protein
MVVKVSSCFQIVFILLLFAQTSKAVSNNLRLNVSNGVNSDETIILFNPNASNGFDAYDSQKMFANNVNIPEIYTYAGNEMVVINGLTDVATNPSINLGFLTAQSGTFSIQVNQINGLEGHPIILEDKVLHKNIDLRTITTYYFTSGICNDTNRFTIHFLSLDKIWNAADNWSNATNWSNAQLPAIHNNVIVQSGELIIDQDEQITDLTISAGASLTINTGKLLHVYGNLFLQSDITGTASLVDNEMLKVEGTSTVQQYITGSGNTTPNGRFWYIGSPVDAATSGMIAAAGSNTLYRYDETKHAWTLISDTTSSLTIGTGYCTRLGNTATISFTGTLNSGDKTIKLTRTGSIDDKRGFNLIANPYPSYLNWDAVFKTNIESTIWYRTNDGTSMVFDTYNDSSHIGTNNNGTGAVSNSIAPMQALWVRVIADGDSGSIQLNNQMRSNSFSNRLKDDVENKIIRLKVANETNSDETILIFNSNALNSYDTYDSEKMFNNSNDIPELYTTAETHKLVINAVKKTGNDTIIPLGFKTTKAGNFSISQNEIQGLEGMSVLLIDKKADKKQDLTTVSTYRFTSDSTDSETRFAIQLIAETTTDITSIEKGIIVFTKRNTIVVSTNQKDDKTTITDVLGRNIESNEISGSQTIYTVEQGIYFVKEQKEGAINTITVFVPN